MFKGKFVRGHRHRACSVINIPAEGERAEADLKGKSMLREAETL